MALLHILLVVALVQFHCLDGFLLKNIVNVVNVVTPVGEIIGQIEAFNFDGNRYNVKEFLGIPFAEPPTGNRRFRKPVPKSNFTHAFHAFDFGPACLQKSDGVIGVHIPVSEDCLFLNIFSPEYVNASSNIPVMVWIHGGWFQMGVSTYYRADVLSVFGDVIVVTINYRLAHLGFLRTDDVIGNFGLWDQHLALRWVKDNIAAFGGDVNNITIFGESAGSVSVAYQTLFAGNQNLFQRAIAESGSITSPWGFATNESALNQFDIFTSAAGCNGSHDDIMGCMRKLTSNDLLRVMNTEGVYNALIVPSRDGYFVPKHPRDMLSPSPELTQSHNFFHSLDLMMGCTSLDGGLYLSVYAYAMNTTNIENMTIPKDLFESFFVPKVLSNVFDDVNNIPQVIKDVTVFEYTYWENPDDDIERTKMLVKLTTDTAMFAPMVLTSQLHCQGGHGRTYLYKFSVKPATHAIYVPTWMDGPTVANHGDDIMFVYGFSDKMVALFSQFISHFNVSKDNIETSKAVMTMWTNFAKTG